MQRPIKQREKLILNIVRLVSNDIWHPGKKPTFKLF